MWHPCIKYIALMAFVVVDGIKIKPASSPTITDNPFSVFWNIPSETCWRQFHVNLDLIRFSIVANAHESLTGSFVTKFDFNNLGSFPYFDNAGNSVNGGVPQNGNLNQHLLATENDIQRIIPGRMFRGLGVIGWEGWRALWKRNLGDKIIYRIRSVDIVQNRHPTWINQTIWLIAEKEFEDGAKKFLNNTLFLAKLLKPYALWGFHNFPECFNYPGGQNYTGECAGFMEEDNNLLYWLWEQSTALYPSISLPVSLRANATAQAFVKHRITEALRVASFSKHGSDLPVFAYLRLAYTNTSDFLLEADLVKTIGESATLGAAGVVLWGDTSFSSARGLCLNLDGYVSGPLGMYIVNVTTAVKYCSDRICSSHGRCVRRYVSLNVFLHLPSPDFRITVRSSPQGKRVHVSGTLQDQVIKQWDDKFRCQCYLGWTGFSCEIPCA